MSSRARRPWRARGSAWTRRKGRLPGTRSTTRLELVAPTEEWRGNLLTHSGHIDRMHKTTESPLGHCRHIGGARTSVSDRVRERPNLHRSTTPLKFLTALIVQRSDTPTAVSYNAKPARPATSTRTAIWFQLLLPAPLGANGTRLVRSVWSRQRRGIWAVMMARSACPSCAEFFTTGDLLAIRSSHQQPQDP